MREKIEPIQERNLRHVFFGMFFFGTLISLLGIFLWETQFKKINPANTQNTLGASTSVPRVDVPHEKAADLLSSIQKEINAITPENITSSDSAILKIIGDLQNLRSGDQSAFETVCSMVCGR